MSTKTSHVFLLFWHLKSQKTADHITFDNYKRMPRVTFDLPDDLHRELSVAVRKHKINLGIAAVQAFRLWLKTSPDEIARMSGLIAGISSSADRKRLEKYAELLRSGQEDVKAVAARRVATLLAVAREDGRIPSRSRE